MPRVIILAGPNGAGKTTFANEYLNTDEPNIEFVNADEIARGADLAALPEDQRALRAGRKMIEEIDRLADGGNDFMLETTLATRGYARKVSRWQASGYIVVLIYLRLSSVEVSIRRVAKRVAAGGHSISEDVIRRRYSKSENYLDHIYKPLVDEWYVWESVENDFALAQKWDE